MNKNQIIEAKCTGYTHDGLGVCKVDGFPIFVKGAVREDLLNVRITKVKKNIAFGRIENIIDSSPFRSEFPCESYKECGGCHIGHLNSDEQAYLKEDKVFNAYKKLASKEISVADCVSMDKPFRYRNKVAVPVKKIDGKIKAGFYKPRSHDLVEFTDCKVQTKNSNEIIKECISIFEDLNITPYDEMTRKGIIRHIVIREGFKTNEVMVCLVINAKQLPNQDKIIERLQSKFTLKTIVVNINQEKTSVILGKTFETIFGQGYIVDYINDICFKISANSFYQINQQQTERLYNKAIELADLQGDEVVLDAYCGIGSIGLNFANSVKKVVGVEIVEQAIVDAKENAKLNGVDNIEFYAGDISEVIKSIDCEFDVVVVDPPRKGCSVDFLKFISQEIKPNKIIYISCDVATQARDVKTLELNGYVTNECFPFDMFPNTHHVETIVGLSKKH